MKTNTTDTTTKLTLAQAVINAINELKVSKNGAFSAHDVTTSIREGANAGEFALPGLEAQQNGAGISYWVKHEDVKAVIDGYLTDGTLKTLGLISVSNSGNFRVFRFSTTAVTAPVAGQTTVQPVQTGVVLPTTTTTNVTVAPTLQKIQAYLRNAGGPVTLKQIQSAVKVNGISCKDFYNILTKAGYTVNVGTAEKFSTYTVG